MIILNGIYRRGDKGPDIYEIQRLLKREAMSIDADGVFGPMTETAVLLFQKEQGLIQDGIVGPITLAKLNPEAHALDSSRRTNPPSGFAYAVIKVAERYVGVRESGGNNRGTHIDRWLKDVGVDPGLPWCMAFVQGCFKEAAAINHFADPLKPDTAGVMDLWNRVHESWRVGSTEGRAGDIMIMDMGKGNGHTGIVTGYSGGHYQTIEGNTNDAGGREGDCVAVKSRNPYTKIKGFVRVPDPGEAVVS